METFIGVLAGGAVTFLASWLFYRRASEDLRRETERLRGLNIMMLYPLDKSGVT
jgi:hypothetical protein